MSDKKVTETEELNKLIKEVRRGRGRPKKVIEVKKAPEPEMVDSDIEILEEVEAKPVKKVVQRRRKRASARLSAKPKQRSAQKAKVKKEVTQAKAIEIAVHQVSSTTTSPLPVLDAVIDVEGAKANDKEDEGRTDCSIPDDLDLPPEGQEGLNEGMESAGGERNDLVNSGLACVKIVKIKGEFDGTEKTSNEAEPGDGNTENRENLTDSKEEERIDSSACAGDCSHARENEMLRSAVKELGRRNTMMEDFIELEFGDKYNQFVKTRSLLVTTVFEDVDNQINGERHSSCHEVVKILGFMRDAAVENKKEVEGSSSKLTSGVISEGGTSAKEAKSMEKPSEALKNRRTSPPPPAIPRAFTRFDGSTKNDSKRPSQQRQSEPARAPIQINLKKAEPNIKVFLNHKRPHSFASTQKDQAPPARSSESGPETNKKPKTASEPESQKYDPKSAATAPAQPDWQQKSASKLKQLISDVRAKAAATTAPSPASPPKLQHEKPISKYLLLDSEIGAKYGTCPVCKEIVKQQFLRDHLQVDHEPGVKCPDAKCREEFKTVVLYEEHVKLKHSVKASYTDIFKKDHVAEKFEWVNEKYKEGITKVPQYLQILTAKSKQKQMKAKNVLGTTGLFSSPSTGGISPQLQPSTKSATLPPLQPPPPKEPPPPLPASPKPPLPTSPPPPLPVPPPAPGLLPAPTNVQPLPLLSLLIPDFTALLQPQQRQGFISPHDPRRLARPRILPGPNPFMQTSPPPPGTQPFQVNPNPFQSPGPSPFMHNVSSFLSPSKK